jgi:putative ABC transport system permease protein
MPPDAVTGALLQVDAAHARGVRDRLYRTEGIAFAQTKEELETQIAELMRNGRIFVLIMYALGAAMAFAVTYTATDIVLWERTRELATLRTMGFGMGRVALLVTIENAGVGALGAVLGVWPGIAISRYLLTEMAGTEGFSLRFALAPVTVWVSAAATLALVVLAQWPGLRRIRGLDLAGAIRVREE